MPAHPLPTAIHTYGKNFASLKPLIDLKNKSTDRKLPTTKLNEALKEKWTYYSKHEDPIWREIYSVAQLVDLFIQGKQLLRRHPNTGAWMITPIKNDAMEKRAINQMRFWENALVAKWQLSSPNIMVRPGANNDKANLAAKAGTAVTDFYEQLFYTSEFNERECKLGIRNGTYIERFRMDDSIQGVTGLRSIIENKNLTIGGGFGYCAECETQGSADMFEPNLQSPVPSFKCPNCGKNTSDVAPPAQAQGVRSVAGQEKVQQGEIVCEQLPLQACRWNLMCRPEESSWFIYQQRTSLSAIHRLLGPLELKGGADDIGLDILDKLAYVGQALSGSSVGGDRKPEIFRQPVKVEEMALGPDDLVDIKLNKEEETVCGQSIPAGVPLSEVYPNGAVICGLNDMSVITGIYAETHREYVVSGYWHMNPNSGAGQGIGDSIEVQKRFNTFDTQATAGLQAGTTPGFLYIKGVIDENEARYLSDPRVAIPVDWSLLPNEAKDLRKLVAPAFTPSTAPGQIWQHLQGFITQQFQNTTGVMEFSSGLPGMAGRNDTATGASIEQATSQAISTPTLQGKACVRKRGMEITIKLFKQCMPIPRWFPMKGKFGRQEFKELSGIDVDAELRFEVVKNSELTRTIYDIRKDLTDFYTQFGGIMGFLQAKKMFPREVSETANQWNVEIEDEDYTVIESICTKRIEQMKQGMSQTQNPEELLSFIQPPVSKMEPQGSIKSKWLQEYLDTDEGTDAPMPLRLAVELLIQQCFMVEVGQQAALAGGAGIVSAVGQAPEALGQKALEGDPQQGQQPPPPQVSPDAALKVQAGAQSQQMAAQQADAQRQHDAAIQASDHQHEMNMQPSAQQKISESASYKDLPPAAQAVMLKQMGLPSNGTEAIHAATVQKSQAKQTAQQPLDRGSAEHILKASGGNKHRARRLAAKMSHAASSPSSPR